jgi:hypothetical protein
MATRPLSTKTEVSYVTDSNGKEHEVRDLTVEKGTDQYIVDAKFMEIFVSHFGLGSWNKLKDKLISLINDARDADEMFRWLEEEVYLYKVINHPHMHQINAEVEAKRREAAIARDAGIL